MLDEKLIELKNELKTTMESKERQEREFERRLESELIKCKSIEKIVVDQTDKLEKTEQQIEVSTPNTQ